MMVPNPIYDCGQIYDSISPPSDHETQTNTGQSVQLTTPRYSYFPGRNLDICTGMPNSLICKYEGGSKLVSRSKAASSLPSVSNATSKKTNKDRNKLHLILPGLPPSNDKLQVAHNIMQDTDISEEGQYIEMNQTGMHRQQVRHPAGTTSVN